MKLLVLAGGFGTRLRSAVPDVPKAMAPVAGLPFLRLQLENWIAQGVKSFVLLLYDQAESISTFVRSEREGLLRQCEMELLTEPVALGTGGAVANAVAQLNLKGDFLLINADTWLGDGIARLGHALAPTVAAVEVPDTSRYGELIFGADDLVTAFAEKRPGSGRGWINAGLCRLSADLFWNWNGDAFSMEAKLFPQLVAAGKLRAVRLTADFADIGVPADYLSFCRRLEANRKGLQ